MKVTKQTIVHRSKGQEDEYEVDLIWLDRFGDEHELCDVVPTHAIAEATIDDWLMAVREADR
jgi:predicted transposase YdaD